LPRKLFTISRYGTGGGSDLAPSGVRHTSPPGRYRPLYRTERQFR